MLTEQDCEQILVKQFAESYGIKESNLNKTQVEVRMILIDWLMAD